MKGNPKIIDLLNEVLTAELTAINQYFLHGKMCRNWGYEVLATRLRNESIDEMKHADELIDRVLFLDGVPNVQRLFKISVGETVKEQLECDLALEHEAVKRLNDALVLCASERDGATRELLERILVSEETHIDWIEAQLTQIAQMGLENYLSVQVR